MSEYDFVKMCIVMLPVICAVIASIIEVIIETVKKRKNGVLFRDKESLKLLAYMNGDDRHDND